MSEQTEKDLKKAIFLYRNCASNTDIANRTCSKYIDRREILDKEHLAFNEIINLVKLIEG